MNDEAGPEQFSGAVVIERIRKILPALVLLLDAVRLVDGGNEIQSDAL